MKTISSCPGYIRATTPVSTSKGSRSRWKRASFHASAGYRFPVAFSPRVISFHRFFLFREEKRKKEKKNWNASTSRPHRVITRLVISDKIVRRGWITKTSSSRLARIIIDGHPRETLPMFAFCFEIPKNLLAGCARRSPSSSLFKKRPAHSNTHSIFQFAWKLLDRSMKFYVYY